MKGIFTYLFGDNANVQGVFGRKFSAFIVILLVVAAHASWITHSVRMGDYTIFTEVITLDFGFIGVCLGLKTYENIKAQTNSQTNSQPNDNNSDPAASEPK